MGVHLTLIITTAFLHTSGIFFIFQPCINSRHLWWVVGWLASHFVSQRKCEHYWLNCATFWGKCDHYIASHFVWHAHSVICSLFPLVRKTSDRSGQNRLSNEPLHPTKTETESQTKNDAEQWATPSTNQNRKRIRQKNATSHFIHPTKTERESEIDTAKGDYAMSHSIQPRPRNRNCS